jgi:hypothetical protein
MSTRCRANPQNAAFIQAKISMLQNASLPADIINGRRWRSIARCRAWPVGRSRSHWLFPLDPMRTESTLAVDTLAPVLGLLEGFFDTPFPTPAIRVWYGFKIGNSGGGGAILLGGSNDVRKPDAGDAGCRSTPACATSWGTATSGMNR